MPIQFENLRVISYPTSIVTSGLTLYLDAGDSTSYSGSGNTWNDLSGSSYNATLVNTPTYSSTNGGYFDFNGTSQYATVSPSALSVGNEMTFSVWTKGVGALQLSAIIGFVRTSLNTARILNIHHPWNDGNIYFDAGDGSGQLNFDRIQYSATSIYTNWNHWVFTKNATSGVMNIYLNGSLASTGTGKTRGLGTTNPPTIAYLAFNGSHYFRGYASQFLLYNRELSSTEVTQNFNALRSRYGI